jgi:hypothetical protein
MFRVLLNFMLLTFFDLLVTLPQCYTRLMMCSICLDKSTNTCQPLHSRYVFAHLFRKKLNRFLDRLDFRNVVRYCCSTTLRRL